MKSLQWLLVAGWLACAGDPLHAEFRRLVLSEEFHSEGADFGDLNGDGAMDVVSGPYWYAGPDFRQRHRYTGGERLSIKGYSRHFFTFCEDLNGDGRTDILTIGMPGQPAYWFENPGAAGSNDWHRHLVLEDVGNESPHFEDYDGDGRRELILVHQGRLGVAFPVPQPDQRWRFRPLSTRQGYGAFTHGLGVGDVDGDHRLDLLETHGWHRQEGQGAVFHPQRFAAAGGSQMFAYDFDRDGDRDVLSVQSAHGWGLAWFERRGRGEDELWVRHDILPPHSRLGVTDLSISQMHAVALADIDGDGVKDIVTGKRYFAHGGGDPGAHELPVLYWLRTVQDSRGDVTFEPHLIDDRTGVGTQLTCRDFDGDGDADILVGNKLGTYLLVRQGPTTDHATLSENLAGTPEFAQGVRDRGPSAPAAEQASFVVPAGFEVDLIASEPQIAKPLNMAFDSRGRLWITDTIEYPYPVEVGAGGRDAIRVLEDANGDGQFERVSTFADGLNIPMGLYPYRDGVICYSIPHIWWLRDTDGDGRCDYREKLYGPFDHTRDTHGMCNAFTRGRDGWLYACHGFNNQSQVAGADGHSITMHSGNTFRMRLDGSRLEHITHGQVNPFGIAYDARGDLFTADCHTKPVTLLMRDGYYESFGKPHDGLGFVPDVMEHLHGSTAIGGIAISAAAAFPAEYRDSTFGGNVMTSRINRNRLVYEGGSVRAEEEPDFLIAGDSWFRPVDLAFGHDGALYVADFYNRIIGHYEVPLDHPGRDRRRGRIWRVRYVPTEDRRDAAPLEPAPRISDLSAANAAGLVERLAEPRIAPWAADELVDRWGDEAVAPLELRLQHSSPSPWVLWCLHRLDALSHRALDVASQADETQLRVAVQRILAERPAAVGSGALLRRGLTDRNALVRRTAAEAAARLVSIPVVPELLASWKRTEAKDVHGHHALKIALRNQLRDADVRGPVLAKAEAEHVSLLAAICLSLPHPDAAHFLVSHLPELAHNRSDLLAAARHVAMYSQGDDSDALVKFAREAFATDVPIQLELLQSLRDGSLAQGRSVSAVVSAWAEHLARSLLAFDRDGTPLEWRQVPHPPSGTERDTWRLSRSRRSADGAASTLLWSSFPAGESRTGIYRSAAFTLASDFSFFLAGHDGFPEQSLQDRNLVRVRDAQTHAVLQQWSPPRNDVAQRQDWRTGELAGRRVYVELVDGDTATAFAWLAAGRFSETRLNPTELADGRRRGVALVTDFQLTSLRAELMEAVMDAERDASTRSLFAQAVASLGGTGARRALARAFALPGGRDFQGRLAVAFASEEGQADVLAEAMQSASSADQLGLATLLASDANGLAMLVQLCAEGKASPRVLRHASVVPQLDAVGTPLLRGQVAELIAALPDESQELETAMDTLMAGFLQNVGDVERGRLVFAQQCSACHQVAGKGKQVGPNLDGIGNRGLARLLEDVMAPNRNVDVAFRSTTVVTEDGLAVTGLMRSESETQVTLIDSEGKERILPRAEIAEQTPLTLSPMPANFRQVLNEHQVRDLLSYLLQLR